MILETKRLILREYTYNDFDGLKAIITDPETMKYYTCPYDENGVKRWLDWCINSYRENGFGLLAIELKESGEFIGDCGISLQKIDGELLPEIGYHINKRHWKKGYAREAAEAARDWLFENTAYEVAYSYMNSENIASYSTAKSMGMTKIKEYSDGDEHLAVYAITRAEWLRIKERKMKKILISGFEKFGGEEINPSWEAVSRLPDVIDGYSLCKIRIPVVFGNAAQKVMGLAERINPDVILCIGQAGGRQAVTPELVAINYRYAAIPDNIGNQPKDVPISEGGESAYFSTLPVRKMAHAINECQIPSQVSYSAGAYVCNDLLYILLEKYKNTDTKVGFIHVPYCTEQGKDPSMSIDDMVKALIVAIRNID